MDGNRTHRCWQRREAQSCHVATTGSIGKRFLETVHETAQHGRRVGVISVAMVSYASLV